MPCPKASDVGRQTTSTVPDEAAVNWCKAQCGGLLMQLTQTRLWHAMRSLAEPQLGVKAPVEGLKRLPGPMPR